MDLNFTEQELAFREEVRRFLDEKLPAEIADKVIAGRELTKSDMERWHAILNARGWLASTWPVDFGGPGWGPVERHIFEEEACRAGAPRVLPFGLHMLAHVLMKFGTKEQQDHYLPRILEGTDWWCQGYSEPGAGSDLASLRTTAVRGGDAYLVNGQKTWTTLGQHANRIFCLVRTKKDGKPQEGISFLLVDLDSPGIEMRPIRLIEGGHEVNEVFFTDVRVPAENLVGDENQGWTIAKYLLTHERTNIAGIGFSVQAFEQVKALARTVKRGGKRLIDDPLYAARLARVEAELEALKITNLRMLSNAQKNGQPGLESSMLKIKGTVIRQALNDLARRALGPAAGPFPAEALAGNLEIAPPEHARAAARYFNNRKISIFGGSNEIQRNILSKSMLEL
ncbi:pimeloyl-CoA dehydrogenase large subunit [Silicimonas algicola]|uniref:Alkylation response protein AidB-like acyl-CoA dehydrogenase n=1 Tax=Silicimonas algicola TaxID=1826607 RepID=A0A316G498_9RHOB|nr:acyl-CoA dehydrogenase family protein [Silicimonas algicola]AZQ68256.1 pimeloyl-CoA dehydrogenase large subunit [Silicimonas algicola]PWK54610.1 alkylation response protein AidB-like acyl-CoA dehydrogenase [Silicimonas algicola]